MIIPEERNFQYCVAEDTYVVWLAQVNRYIQLKEPAFFVFEQWAEGKNQKAIANVCTSRYDLPTIEALRFTNEIISEIEKLYSIEHGVSPSPSPLVSESLSPLVSESSFPSSPRSLVSPAVALAKAGPFVLSSTRSFVSERTCLINSTTISFRYGDEELEEIFRPLFRQFEVDPKSMEHGAWGMGQGEESEEKRAKGEGLRAQSSGLRNVSVAGEKSQIINQQSLITNKFRSSCTEKSPNITPLQSCKADNTIELFSANNTYCIRINGKDEQRFSEEDFEHFHGAVYMGLLNILYDKKQSEWMGIFHASGVTNGKEALLFMAASGSGKSTIAALMMAYGYHLVSDDFLPVALTPPEIYSLPTAISVKKNAIQLLKDYFPSLAAEEADLKDEEEDFETFLPLTEGSLNLPPVRAKAIVFVRYDPSSGYRLTLESNLSMMNDFLKQAWIGSSPEAAGGFLEWYFHLPVYSLVYSDSEQAIRGMTELIKNREWKIDKTR